VDDHRAEAAAYNRFNGQKPPIPFRADSGGYIPDVSSIAPGATCNGSNAFRPRFTS
jgi:hypothetical protein